MYSIGGKIFDVYENDIIGVGNEGTTYLIGGEAVKIYGGFCLKSRLGPDGVDILSKIPTNRIVLPKDKVKNQQGYFCGYTTKYIDKVEFNHDIVTMRHLLNELLLYEQDLALLSQNGVIAYDMNYDNIVYSHNNSIYMIDPGSFDFSDTTTEHINNEFLTELFLQLMSAKLETKNQYDELCKNLNNGNRLYDNIINTLDSENETITNYSLKMTKRR